MQGFREVAMQEHERGLSNERGILAEQGADLFRKAAGHGVAAEFAFERIGVGGPAAQGLRLEYFPKVIALESPKRILGMNGLAGWTELLQQGPELGLDVGIGRQARFAPDDAAEREQDRQGLVRGPLVAALPNVDFLHAVENSAAECGGGPFSLHHILAGKPRQAGGCKGAAQPQCKRRGKSRVTGGLNGRPR